MEAYQQMITRQRKWMFYLLALFVLGWGLTPYASIFLGLLLGSSLSFYNLWLMQRKVDKFGEATARQKSVKGIGTFSRLMAGGLAVLIALQFEEYFHLIAVVLGLMTAYIVIMIEFLFFRTRD
ncbi:ATP synthase subunit I [Halobacillus sp. MO56]